MIKKGFKILFFLIFSLVLILPFVYSFTELNNRITLKGAVDLAEKPTLKYGNWFDGEFQSNYEKYINDNIGFRPIFVRIRNQVAYSFFDEINAASVIRGKENYLYERNYIKAFNGTDFIGADSIYYKTRRIKLLQDSLQKMDKTLIVCLAAGKGSFYPQYFPEKYKLPPSDSTNQKFYVKAFKELGVNHIDFNKWFLEMKDTSRYILYPKYGIHWSEYGMLLSVDSLVSYVEKKRKVNMPNLLLSNYKLSKDLNNSDYDIADGLNLIFKLPVETMCYPDFVWENDSARKKPKVVVIADSFYWSMYGTGLWNNSFSPGGFWYYNRLVYPDSFEETLNVKDVNYWKAIENTDVFIVLVTEANLPKFSWGFVENALEAFSPDYDRSAPAKRIKVLSFEEELQKNITNIKANENWMKEIKRKSKLMNISVDSMLIIDATWMIEYKKSQEKK
ncbi:MAG: hypothetical protein HN778_19205 [Prolixibacteraceae bacterium]|jgi:hypothetical protein|nr:hypothetical protein [Prolixibacteraceae bacterium]MBT6006123.1 hypothetical protein [Prolixibacteraceae bacterium]MBT6764117.1 hypothetical protein [Prolixibacteraceae bacterium]MBT6998108.1 hypothetical protein [Prolixibacteraceae bacterium]MBT7396966.1 hypothetical protein [Prolixibacteraceae bacterium]